MERFLLAKSAAENLTHVTYNVYKLNIPQTTHEKLSQSEVGGRAQPGNHFVSSLLGCVRSRCKVELRLKNEPHDFSFSFLPKESSLFPWRFPLPPTFYPASAGLVGTLTSPTTLVVIPGTWIPARARAQLRWLEAGSGLARAWALA